MKPAVFILSMLLVPSAVQTPHEGAVQVGPALESAVLRDLREQLQNGVSQKQTLDAFWTRVAALGAPLVEVIPSAPDRRLLTFLYRSDSDARVSLVPDLGATRSNGLDGGRETAGNLERLANSDVYFASYDVSAALRLTYRFDVDGQATLDPLNPHVFLEGADLAESVVALPDAPEQPWAATAAAGKWAQHQVDSAVLGAPQTVWVYTPSSYDPSAVDGYPALVGLNSLTYGRILPTARVIEYLMAHRKIRPTLIIAGPDLAEVGDKGSYDPAVGFLADELLPWARTRFRISSNPSEIVISGASRRGMLAAYAALRRPDVFGGVLSLSGSFYWKPPSAREFAWLPALFAREPKQPVTLYLAAGSLEIIVTPTNAGHYLLGTNRHMRDVLTAKGYTFHFTEFYGLHSPGNWQDQLMPGLDYLLGHGARGSRSWPLSPRDN